jgi:hypothetical protein
MLRAVAGTASGPPPTPPQDVYSPGELAAKLRFYKRDGTVNRTPVYDLIRSGAIALIDPSQPITRWRISHTEYVRYLAEGPRKGTP